MTPSALQVIAEEQRAASLEKGLELGTIKVVKDGGDTGGVKKWVEFPRNPGVKMEGGSVPVGLGGEKDRGRRAGSMAIQELRPGFVVDGSGSTALGCIATSGLWREKWRGVVVQATVVSFGAVTEATGAKTVGTPVLIQVWVNICTVIERTRQSPPLSSATSSPACVCPMIHLSRSRSAGMADIRNQDMSPA